MLTEKDYCDLELATILQEVGMSIKNIVATSPRGTDNWYSNVTLYEAQKWLREVKRICVEVDCCAGGYVWELCKAYNKDWFSGGTTIYVHYCEDNSINTLLNDCGKYESYEDALLEGIKEAVKILKDGIGK